jgi:hypothetical protein
MRVCPVTRGCLARVAACSAGSGHTPGRRSLCVSLGLVTSAVLLRLLRCPAGGAGPHRALLPPQGRRLNSGRRLMFSCFDRLRNSGFNDVFDLLRGHASRRCPLGSCEREHDDNQAQKRVQVGGRTRDKESSDGLSDSRRFLRKLVGDFFSCLLRPCCVSEQRDDAVESLGRIVLRQGDCEDVSDGRIDAVGNRPHSATPRTRSGFVAGHHNGATPGSDLDCMRIEDGPAAVADGRDARHSPSLALDPWRDNVWSPT